MARISRILYSGLLLTALAQPALGKTLDEPTGVRSAAMGGAHRGVGTSNDAVNTNPAGMAISTRYAVELSYGYSPLGEVSRTSFSAVDSKAGPVAGGFSYQYIERDAKGTEARLHLVTLGSAYRLNRAVAFGVSVRHVRGDAASNGVSEEIELYTGDIGIMVALDYGLSAGFTYHNVVETDSPDLTPPALGFGAAITTASLVFSTDIRVDLSDKANEPLSYYAGGEYFLGGVAPIRLGYRREPLIRASGAQESENIITGGCGYVNDAGSIDMSLSRSIERPKNWQMLFALQFFI